MGFMKEQVKDYFKMLEKAMEGLNESERKRLVLLYQIGTFYEIFYWEKSKINIQFQEIKDITNLTENPTYMYKSGIVRKMGLRMNEIRTGFEQKLLRENYILRYVDQVGKDIISSKIIRELQKDTIKYGMDIQQNLNTSIIQCIYIDTEIKTFSIINIDIMSGFTEAIEINEKDTNMALEKIYKEMITKDVKNIVLYIITLNEKEYNTINRFLELDDITVKEINRTIQKEYYNREYQNEIFNTIYSKTEIEYLTNKHPIRVAFSLLINYIYKYNPDLLARIKLPKVKNEDKLLQLEYTAAVDLQINNRTNSNTNNNASKTKIDSLIKLMTMNCATAVGREKMKNRILNPINDEEEINKRYKRIERMIKGDKYKKIIRELKGITQMNGIIKRIQINSTNYKELEKFTDNIDRFNNLINNNEWLIKEYGIETTKKNMEKYLENWKDIFIDLNTETDTDTNDLDFESDNENGTANENGTVNDDESSIKIQNKKIEFKIKPGTYSEYDKINNNLNRIMTRYNSIITNITNKIKEKEKKKTKSDTKYVTLKKTEKTGIKMTITKTRYDKLSQEAIKQLGIKIVKDGKSFKIYSDEIMTMNSDYQEYERQKLQIQKEIINKETEKINIKYKETIDNVQEIISEIDFTSTSAKIAIEYKYNCPEVITNNSEVTINIKALRHAICERINTTEYITNDINFTSNEQRGYILKGDNGSGKTALMKAVGICIILAQAGMYVPAKSMKYTPINKILTRINGNDNIFKQQSTYQLEIMELISILNKAGQKTLIIGDEMCKGTEIKSAYSLVVSVIEAILKSKSLFMISTHMNDITKEQNLQKYIKDNTMKECVLKVIRDKNNQIEYTRKLTNINELETEFNNLYGLEMAEAFGMQYNVIKRAKDIRNRITNRPENMINPKRSKYNKNIFMNECYACNRNYTECELHTHHLFQQCDASKDRKVTEENREHVSIDNESLLIVLCKECHIKVHQKDIKYKKVETNYGIKTKKEKKEDIFNKIKSLNN